MATEKFTFLDEVGIQKLAEALLGKVNNRIAERIVQEINDSSDANHVPSAAILNTLLKARDAKITANTTAIGANTTAIGEAKTSITELGEKVDANKTAIDTATTDLAALSEKVDGLTHLTIDTVTGPISSVADPSSSVLYLQRDDENDTTWLLYIYREDGTWVNIGDTEVDLSNYWSKDDVDAMKEALGVPEMVALTEAQITAAVDKAFTETDFFNPPLTGFDFSTAMYQVFADDSVNLVLVPTPATAKLPTDLVYESVNTEFATVDSTGVVTGVAKGVATINVTSASTGFTATTKVNVTFPAVTVNDSNAAVNGSGEYRKGATVSIDAGTPEDGKQFAGWTVVGATLADTSLAQTTFVMPNNAVTVTAKWEAIAVQNIDAVNFQ